MNRLQTQWQRLYVPTTPSPPAEPSAGSPAPGLGSELLSPCGEVRALVLELARPADWEPVARLWQGVQADLQWPAPAIAVNGSDGYQLWLSVAAPLPLSQARATLAFLQSRYWGDVNPKRVRAWPAPAGQPLGGIDPAPAVPQLRGDTGQWSAFVTRDLAPVFAESPWLDIPPNPEGQADLLSSLHSIPLADVIAAVPAVMLPTGPAEPTAPMAPSQARGATAAIAPAASEAGRAGIDQDPASFLRRVMNDERVELALRIEAAKALLRASL